MSKETGIEIIQDITKQDGTENTYYIVCRRRTSTDGENPVDNSQIESFEAQWEYYTSAKDGEGYWFFGASGTVETNSFDRVVATYDAPENATFIRVRLHIIAKTKSNNSRYFTKQWTEFFQKNLGNTNIPDIDEPEVEQDGIKLTMRVDNIPDESVGTGPTLIKYVQFDIVRNGNMRVALLDSEVKKGAAAVTYNMGYGHEYKVRARGIDSTKNIFGDWSAYTSTYYAPPATPVIESITAEKNNGFSVRVKQQSVAKSYTMQYTTDKNYFDKSPSAVQSVTITDTTIFRVINLSGAKYYLRVRSANSSDVESPWTAIMEVSVGRKPAAPTIWTLTSTVAAGSNTYLYWTHNSLDGSSWRSAVVELQTDPTFPSGDITTDQKHYHLVVNNPYVNNDDKKDQNGVLLFNTATDSHFNSLYQYSTDGKIYWRVKTQGVVDEYGEWSTSREFTVYEQPSLDVQFDTGCFNEDGTVLEAMPLAFSVTETNGNIVSSVTISILSRSDYTGTDDQGNPSYIREDDVVYQSHENYLVSGSIVGGVDKGSYSAYRKGVTVVVARTGHYSISPADVILQNGRPYVLRIVAYTSLGLSTTFAKYFTVSMNSTAALPDASLYYNPEDATVSIAPYCADNEGDLIEGVVLSVYRHNVDGSLTEIATGMENIDGNTVIDLHPTLGTVTYRIVSRTSGTGSITATDTAPFEVLEKAIIIQWDEVNTQFVSSGSAAVAFGRDSMSTRVYSGNSIRLPYNINIQESVEPDVALIKYIGRNSPVSYYGTQTAVTGSWTTEIDKKDVDMIRKLRALASYHGDVYVREPSGIGYWARVTVSFSINHLETTIPITLNVTRVESPVV